MKKSVLILFLLAVSLPSLYAQEFDISAQLKPRFESRHGFKELIGPDEDAANFVSQRTRLIFNYGMEKIDFRVSVQNVRVWGDAPTMNANGDAIGFFEAYANLELCQKLHAKFGRQVIAYDDERIFGGVEWAQSARSHDAFVLKYVPNEKHKIDVGFAYNSDNEYLTDSLYSNVAGYKTFQYGWYHGDFNKLGLSFLLLNTGIEYLVDAGTPDQDTEIDFFQTIGPRLTWKNKKVSADAAAYVQTGANSGRDVMASYFDANVKFQFAEAWAAAAGGAFISGRDMNDDSSDNLSFNPIFGTNHKFNGLMDYFYVGNHLDNVGLVDVNASLIYSKNKFTAKLTPHYFQSNGRIFGVPADGENIGEELDKYLGTEIDFTCKYEIAPYANIQAGYSQMLATESMEALKGGDKDESQHWAWVMIVVKPTLFSSKKKAGTP